MNSSAASHSRFIGIELLRFFSALAVLVVHYLHFYLASQQPFVPNRQPFYDYLFVFYSHGNRGVHFFWMISGFIFFWKYRQAIADRQISSRRFAFLRFTRLYPLHFFTLILVAILQYRYRDLTANFFLYPHNDLWHFVLQLFMASHWGLQKAHSFNGPIWSVSVEIMVYIFFFVSAASFMASARKVVWFALLFIVLGIFFPQPFVQCLAYFYAGGLLQLWLESNPKNGKGWRYLALAAVLALLALWLMSRLGDRNLFLLPFFLSLLYLFSRLQVKSRFLLSLFSTLGNLTYSSYLWQFPLQVFLAWLISLYGWQIDFSQKTPFLIYLGGVLVLAWFSFHLIEAPAQNFLRRRFGHRFP